MIIMNNLQSQDTSKANIAQAAERIEQFNSDIDSGLTANICQWKHNGFSQVTASSDPDLGFAGFEYNAFGDIVTKTDALDRNTFMTYDSLGRMTQKTLPNDEGSVLYKYDTHSQSSNALGRMVEIDDPSQKKIFSYDKMGRVKKEIREIKDPNTGLTVTSGAFVTSFEYDLLNRKRSIYYPKDPGTNISISAKYRYSSMGVTAVEVYNPAGKKNIVSNILFNEFGQMTEILRGNTTNTEYSYDIKGRLNNLITTTNTNDVEKNLQNVEYTFKIDNSISSTVNKAEIDTSGAFHSAVTYNYKYDGLNRLIKADGEFTKSSAPNISDPQDTINTFERGFHYADNGNMTGKDIYDYSTHNIIDSRSYSYANNNHAVTGIDSSQFGSQRFLMAYDDSGNMIEQRDYQKNLAKQMQYDSYNRITRVTNPDNNDELIGQYWYDDQGFRVRKVANREIQGEPRQVEVLYPSMYFGLEKHRTPQGETVDDTSYAINNIYLNGVRIAAVIPSGGARYYLTDQVDSVKVVVDDDGNAVTRMEYLPYGETWFQEGDENNAAKYNSQELDKETGYYFYNARHYDPEISRFVTPDTVIDGEWDTQGWNQFSYVGNSPILYKDPTGHFKEKSESHEYTYKADEGGTDVRQDTVHGGEVEKGDTLWSIAKNDIENKLGKGEATNKRIKAKVAEIKHMNGLKNDLIKPGKTLITGKSSKVIGEGGLEEPPVSPLDVVAGAKAIYKGVKLGVTGIKAGVKALTKGKDKIIRKAIPHKAQIYKEGVLKKEIHTKGKGTPPAHTHEFKKHNSPDGSKSRIERSHPGKETSIKDVIDWFFGDKNIGGGGR